MQDTVETLNKEGLEGLLGLTITLFCMNYIYTGKLVGINNNCIKLENPKGITSSGLSTGPIFQEIAKYIIDYFQIPPNN